MKKLLFSLLFFSIQSIYAQSYLDLNTQFITLFEKGAYTEALPIGLKAVQQAIKEYGKENINYAIAVHNVAEAYNELKQTNNAKAYYYEAIFSYSISVPEPQLSSAAICNNSVGVIYLKLNNNDSAAIYLERSFAYFISNYNDEYNNAIAVMNNLVELYFPSENFAAAEKVFIKMLPIIEEKEGLFSKNYQVTYENIMYALKSIKNYSAMQYWLNKMLMPTLNKYGINSKEYADLTYTYGNCYTGLNKIDSAIYLYKQSYNTYLIINKTKPSNDFAFAANNIGLAYLDQKQYDSSAKYLEIAFAYFSNNPSTEYDNAIQLMQNLQELYLPQEKYDPLITVYNKSIVMIEKKEGIYGENYFLAISGIAAISKTQATLVKLEEQLKKIILSFEKNNKVKDNEWYPEYLYLLAKCYKNQEKYEPSISTYQQTMQAYNVLLKNTDSKNVMICYNDLGIIYLAQSKYDLAATYFQKSFAYFEKNKLTEYQNLMVVTTNLLMVYNSSKKYFQSKKICETVLPIIEAEETEFSENYCTILSDLCTTLRWLFEYKQMEQNVVTLLKCVQKVYGEKSMQYAEALDVSAMCQIELNNFAAAETILNQSLQLKKELGTKAITSQVLTYVALGNLKGAQGLYNDAYINYGKAAKILEQEKLTESQDYIAVLQSWGYTYIEGGMYAEAKKMLNQVLAQQSKYEGENFSGNASILVSIANAEFQLNEFTSGEIHANKAIEIAKKNPEIKDVIATAKGILGLIAHKKGNSLLGIQHMQESANLNEQIFGAESIRVALTYTSFSLIYQEMGRYAEAEIVLKKAMAIQQKIYGKSHPEYALSLMNLAMVYAMQGGNEKAVDMLKESMQIYMDRNLAGTPNFIKLLANLTYIVNKLGLYDEAKKLHLQTLDILNTRNEKISYNRYIVLNNLSVTCISLNEYSEAEKYVLEALDIVEKIQGKNTIEYVKTINNLVLVYRKQGKSAMAKKLTDDLLPLARTVLGDDAELLSTIYFNEALFASEENNIVESANYLSKATNIVINNFKQNFYTLSEKEKLNWWQEKDYLFALYPSLLTRFPEHSKNIVEAFANLQIQLKGFVLSDASAALRKARNSGNKEVNSLIDEWQAARSLIAQQMALPLQERYYNMDSLNNQANAFEKKINQLAANTFTIQTQTSFTWKNIQAKLKNNQMAVEFVRFPFYNNSTFTDTFKYAALIIKPNEQPIFVSLTNEQNIEWCLSGGKTQTKEVRVNSIYRSTIKKQNNNTTFAGDSLFNLVWKPLMPYTHNVKSVVYAPDGLLHKVAFHALPLIANEKYLIDEFELAQYPSIKQLTEVSNQPTTTTSAFLMGNVNFNTLTQTTTGTNNFTTTVTSGAWAALPGTENEINAVEKTLLNKQIKVTTLKGTLATEQKFKSLNNQSPSIIHLATHGFFLPEPNAQNNKTAENSFTIADDPLIRSGIVTAGANYVWSGKSVPIGIEDGILTAYEIAQLNLSNTQLVVLSACETALGDLKGTEGVFGLQRAFKIAGVKNMIVSLWQVPDKETAELMTLFYNNLATNNSTVREAFTKAQKEMRSKYPPFSWAAFVLVE